MNNEYCFCAYASGHPEVTLGCLPAVSMCRAPLQRDSGAGMPLWNVDGQHRCPISIAYNALDEVYLSQDGRGVS